MYNSNNIKVCSTMSIVFIDAWLDNNQSIPPTILQEKPHKRCLRTRKKNSAAAISYQQHELNLIYKVVQELQSLKPQ